MTRRGHIPRPTETAALARAARRPAEPAPVPVLFAALLAAYAVRDREGIRLFAHAITRRGGA
ncbi:hypothetical protein ACFSL4_17745 [Streptomyces caeni]|uniref:Uncharacterized protein n=1 Tax=Streptomyces caeni TaxID=2307231 RepID=A0ABW4ISV8_9ACTN